MKGLLMERGELLIMTLVERCVGRLFLRVNGRLYGWPSN